MTGELIAAMIFTDMNNKKNGFWKKFTDNFHLYSGWLTPGIGVKRWLIMILFGTTLIGIGFGVIILDIYRTAPETWWLPILSTASLRFLPRPIRALIFGGIGFAFIFIGIRQLNRSIMKPFVKPGSNVVDTLRLYKRRERGPNIVVIGGGHGLSMLLRGLKKVTYNLTAVVTVADDGGSSGKLRQTLGILPPGDIRNCLAALSNDEALMAQLFQYRFGNGTVGLNGHSFGNLFISALTDITGSFEDAVVESGKVLAVHGKVFPSTNVDVKLVADVSLVHSAGNMRIEGESKIPSPKRKVKRVWLEPNNPPAYPGAIQAILNADLIVVGPGSLYTSLLPNLLVPDLAKAIQASKAMKFYVCNVATQKGETTGYTCRDHLMAIEEHVRGELFDIIIVNQNFKPNLPKNVEWVRINEDLEDDYAVYRADLIDNVSPWRHDPQKIAQIIMELYMERTGPLVE